MPTLFLMVGLPGSGKTTKAKQLELNEPAVRLTPDEWMVAFSFDSYDETRRAQVENLQWDVAKQILTLGMNVILDWGFWFQIEREDYRKRANDIGVKCKVVYQHAPRKELLQRLQERIKFASPNSIPVSPDLLDLWTSWFEPPTKDELL